jgi:predicted nucleic acid-binding protein
VILVDTNILLRRASPTDPDRPHAIAAVASLSAAGERLCIVPQTLYEFWATATRPQTSNGLGLTADECFRELVKIKAAFVFLPDHPTLYDQWESLVVASVCHGRISYDARMAAAMQTHGIKRILTFNGTDFARFPGIAIIDPRSFPLPPTSAVP